MGDAVVERIRSKRLPIFIYLTAGDHGRDSVYWRQRELAALQSTRVALGVGPDARAGCDTLRAVSHPVTRCVLGGSVSVFLRLPDGNRNGAGFARNQFESMRKLRAKTIAGVSAIDHSTRYRDWSDLAATVNALVRMLVDSTRLTRMVVHSTDPSVRINPHDHYDHRVAGKLTESLARASGLNARYYVGYAVATRAANRSTVQRQEKLAVFSAYDDEMIRMNPAWSAYRERPRFYAECMQRTYSRSVSSATPARAR